MQAATSDGVAIRKRGSHGPGIPDQRIDDGDKSEASIRSKVKPLIGFLSVAYRMRAAYGDARGVTQRSTGVGIKAGGRAGLYVCIAAMAAMFADGTNLAYAATPSVVETLPLEAAGVVGSGPLLSIQLRPANGKPGRILGRGDVFAEGWVLTDLTPGVATLTRSGESRSIGLNPSGALAQPPSPPSEVVISVLMSLDDLAILEAAKASGWDGKLGPGMTLQETQRAVVYSQKIGAATRAASAAGTTITDDALKVLFGDDAWTDRQAIIRKSMIVIRQAAVDQGDINRVRVMDGLAALGPESFDVPAGTSREAAARASGLTSTAGYSSRLQPDGGYTMTKLPGTGRSTISDPSSN